ncbi:hypothetical protein SAMN05660464_1352 [Geodermatophilus dictyosporus]|uniref:PknH-like extracellular domain-containing protein n=1 Tax=Geodermatophilus dictyosporus TaxID=1523247 RepID=A0A1I5KQF4_9ACTN|nr:hypothetical protein [Geodermatophilus dictyosporus]SFO87350.1 hypothetical protein SAMN05660464_1352 [Geodermatophilus dictyosporus]
MNPGRSVALAVGLLALTGCTPTVAGSATPAPATATPATVEELGALVLARVPSGLPRIPDEDLAPPAGAKSVDDVAGYAEDPARERAVLRDYGYRHGWERFWGSTTGPLTSVFVDQFDAHTGAAAYAEDLAGNDAALYEGVLRRDPADLPGGCSLLTVTAPADGTDPTTGLSGPAAFAWCAHGVFSVAVTAVADSTEAATAELRAVVLAQLDRLPLA